MAQLRTFIPKLSQTGSYHQPSQEKKVHKDKQNKIFGGITVSEYEEYVYHLENMETLIHCKSHQEIKIFYNISCKTYTSSRPPQIFVLSILTSKDKFKYTISLIIIAI